MSADTRAAALNSPNLRMLSATHHGAKKGAVNINLASFLDEQRRYAGTYATEGRGVVAAWNASPSKQASAAIHGELGHFGFGTPIVKARVKPASLVCSISAPARKEARCEEANGREEELRAPRKGHPAKTVKPQTRVTQLAKNAPAPEREKRPATKRCTRSSSDAENAARLTERRDRKRARREIMKPTHKKDKEALEDDTDDQDDEDGPRPSRRKKGQAKKTRKPKLPAGLSLMQGFMATNVGKSRLTTAPLTGVFGKGKASAKVDVKTKPTKKTKAKGATFDEYAFLNKVHDDSIPLPGMEQDRSASEESFGTESHTISSSGARKKFIITNRGLTKKAKSKPPPSASTAADRSHVQSADLGDPPDAPQASTSRAESIVWDIENESKSMPSRVSSIVSKADQRTVLVDTGKMSWARAPSPVTAADSLEVLYQQVSEAPLHSRSPPPSLGPWNSASQVGLGAHPPFVTSKFFSQSNDTEHRTIHGTQRLLEVVHPGREVPLLTQEESRCSRSPMAMDEQTEQDDLNAERATISRLLLNASLPVEHDAGPDHRESVLTTASLNSLDRALWEYEADPVYFGEPLRIEDEDEDEEAPQLYREDENFRPGFDTWISLDALDNEEFADVTGSETDFQDIDCYDGYQGEVSNDYLENTEDNLYCADADQEVADYWEAPWGDGCAVGDGDQVEDDEQPLYDVEDAAVSESADFTTWTPDSASNAYDAMYSPDGSLYDCGGTELFIAVPSAHEDASLPGSDASEMGSYGSDDGMPSREGTIQQFNQGRRLLFSSSRRDTTLGPVARVEEDVAKALRNHWLPQRL